MADEAQHKDITIEGSKVEAGRDIHIGDKTEVTNISRLVVYLTTESGYSNDEIQRIIQEFENQLGVDQVQDKDRKVRHERYIASLERAFRVVTGAVRKEERHELLRLMSEWTMPVINRCKEYDDYHSPYGDFCSHLFTAMCPIEAYLMSSLSSSSKLQMKTVMDWIFTTKDLLVELPGYEKGNVVYLDVLTRYFPNKSFTGKPLGFYLATRDPVTKDGIVKPFFISLNEQNKGPLELLLVTDENLNGLRSILHGEGNEDHPDGLKDIAKRLNKTFASPKNHVFSAWFDESKMFLWDTGQDYLGHRTFSMSIDFKNFSSFLMGMVSDFLRLGSKAIEYRHAHERDIDQLSGLIPKT